ncbi:hypothetical protein [Roseimaritima sediminicola]|uniref:hypothetical protein n=1 Tax=Roseimaritima sediminicola TaxID=2662066 RepID=UPI001386C258|nr:hypothetical protein [Roseimaritima sediminicola]
MPEQTLAEGVAAGGLAGFVAAGVLVARGAEDFANAHGTVLVISLVLEREEKTFGG